MPYKKSISCYNKQSTIANGGLFRPLMFNFYLYLSTYGFTLNISCGVMFSLPCSLLLMVGGRKCVNMLRTSVEQGKGQSKKNPKNNRCVPNVLYFERGPKLEHGTMNTQQTPPLVTCRKWRDSITAALLPLYCRLLQNGGARFGTILPKLVHHMISVLHWSAEQT